MTGSIPASCRNVSHTSSANKAPSGFKVHIYGMRAPDSHTYNIYIHTYAYDTHAQVERFPARHPFVHPFVRFDSRSTDWTGLEAELRLGLAQRKKQRKERERSLREIGRYSGREVPSGQRNRPATAARRDSSSLLVTAVEEPRVGVNDDTYGNRGAEDYHS